MNSIGRTSNIVASDPALASLSRPGRIWRQVKWGRMLSILAAILVLVSLTCSPPARAADKVSTSRDPVIVKLRVGSFRTAIDSSHSRHSALKSSLTSRIERVARARADRLITIEIVDLKFQYSELSTSQRRVVRQLAGKEDPGDWYERQVAALHRYLVRKASDSAGGGVSVANLPLERSPNGKPISTAVQTRYASLIKMLDAFVISVGTGIESGEVDPAALMQALPQALAQAGKRPIFYRAGSKWEVIEDPQAVLEAYAAGRTGGGDPAKVGGGTMIPFEVNQVLAQEVLPILSEVGGEQAIIIYQWPVDPNQTGVLDLEALDSYIQKNVPADYASYATLDFEHPYFKWLRYGPGDPQWQQAHDQLLGALRLAKSLRPQAKWTIWGLPRIYYGQYNPGAIALVKAPAELLAEMDWMAPSIYDRYPDGDSPGRVEKERLFIENVITISREIAGDRPVLPYVWHRYAHNEGGRFKYPEFLLVPESEVRQNIGWALELGVDGIVWWGGDDFHVRLLENPPKPGDTHYTRYLRLKTVYEEETPPGMSYQEHVNEVHGQFLRLMGEILPVGEESEPNATQLKERTRRTQLSGS